jgi:hypothetical protein
MMQRPQTKAGAFWTALAERRTPLKARPPTAQVTRALPHVSQISILAREPTSSLDFQFPNRCASQGHGKSRAAASLPLDPIPARSSKGSLQANKPGLHRHA